jgi:hypothetical protein
VVLPMGLGRGSGDFNYIKRNGRHSTEANSNVFKSVHYLTLQRICGLSMAVKAFGFEENVL